MLADIVLWGEIFIFVTWSKTLPYECPRNELKRSQRVWQNLAHGSLAHHSRFVKHIHVNSRRHSARRDRPEFPKTTLPRMICTCDLCATIIPVRCCYLLYIFSYVRDGWKRIRACNNRDPLVICILFNANCCSNKLFVFEINPWIWEERRRINIPVCIISINSLPFSRESYFTIEYNTWDVCIFRRKYYFEYVVPIIDIFPTHFMITA